VVLLGGGIKESRVEDVVDTHHPAGYGHGQHHAHTCHWITVRRIAVQLLRAACIILNIVLVVFCEKVPKAIALAGIAEGVTRDGLLGGASTRRGGGRGCRGGCFRNRIVVVRKVVEATTGGGGIIAGLLGVLLLLPFSC